MTDQMSFDDLPDPGRDRVGRYHRHGQRTEWLAAHLVVPRSGTQAKRYLDALRSEGDDGLSDYEAWSRHGIGARPHVPGTRREELIDDGWPIRDSGRVRPTDTGTPAIVWVFEEPDRMLTEEGGVNESSSGVHGQQMSPLPSEANRDVSRTSASTSPPAVSVRPPQEPA